MNRSLINVILGGVGTKSQKSGPAQQITGTAQFTDVDQVNKPLKIFGNFFHLGSRNDKRCKENYYCPRIWTLCRFFNFLHILDFFLKFKHKPNILLLNWQKYWIHEELRFVLLFIQ